MIDELFYFIILNLSAQFIAFLHMKILKGTFPKLNWKNIHGSYFVITCVLCYVLKIDYTIFWGILIASTFILSIFVSIQKRVEKQAEKEKVKGKNLKWQRAKIIYEIFLVAIVVLVYIFFHKYVFIALFLCIPAIIFAKYIFIEDTKIGFYQLQQRLATSKVQSVAMGLAELEGQVHEIEMIPSPLNQKQKCIGYLHIIEEESKNDEGKISYHIIEKTSKCCSFILTDDTGSIEIKADQIHFNNLDRDKQVIKSSNRHTQYLLQPGMRVLLIGKASELDGKTIIEYDEHYKILALAPITSVNRWNNMRPFIQSAKLYAYVLAILIALIMIATIKVDGNIVTLKW